MTWLNDALARLAAWQAAGRRRGLVVELINRLCHKAHPIGAIVEAQGLLYGSGRTKSRALPMLTVPYSGIAWIEARPSKGKEQMGFRSSIASM